MGAKELDNSGRRRFGRQHRCNEQASGAFGLADGAAGNVFGRKIRDVGNLVPR